MGVYIFWFALAVLSGMYANKLNRNPIGYFLLSVFLSPIIGFAALLILGYKIDDTKQDNDNRIYGRYRIDIQTSDYDKVLNKALEFYEDYDLHPSEYNTDDDDEKVFKNDKKQYFVIKRVNNNIVLESFDLPKFKDIKPEIIEPKRTNIDDLSKLAELFEKGLLTQQEFDTQKAKLLNA